MDKKLDLTGVTIYTEDDVIDAMCLIGEEVYVSNYNDFSIYSKHEFIGINYVIDNLCSTLHPFICRDVNEHSSYRYLILAKDARFVEEEKAKEKVLRPFKDISEFANETCCEEIGDVITIRSIGGLIEETVAYNGYRTVLKTNKTTVFLGLRCFDFKELKDYYLYLSGGEWLPFGVEE